MGDFLVQLGDMFLKLLPVGAGAVLTFIGALAKSRSDRLTARDTAKSNAAVARADQTNQRRIKLDELTYRDRRALVDEMLEHLLRYELRKGDPRAPDWDAERAVLDYRAEGETIVARMRAVFPPSVTDAAESAVKVVTDTAQSSRARRWSRRTESGPIERLLHSDEKAQDGRVACKQSRNEFLVEVQKSMTRIDGGAE